MIIDSREINKELILSLIDQKDIFKKYLGFEKIEFSKLYVNPLRDDDDSPSSSFSWANNGMLKFTDWPMRGQPNWSIDCFNVVQILYKCNFPESLKLIYDHFNLINQDEINNEILHLRKNAKVSKKKEIKVEIKNWSKIEIDYWKEYYIDEEILSLGSVYPVRTVWINDKLYYMHKYSDIAFVYFFGNSILKVYFPLRKKDEVRFIQNNSKILQGSQLLSLSGDTCIITKSYKDVLAMRLFGIEAVAPMTETILINESQYSILSSRFKKLYSLFDYDRTGIKIAVKHKMKYNIPILMFDKNQDKKDFTDNLKKYGYQYMNDYIEEFKENLL